MTKQYTKKFINGLNKRFKGVGTWEAGVFEGITVVDLQRLSKKLKKFAIKSVKINKEYYYFLGKDGLYGRKTT